MSPQCLPIPPEEREVVVVAVSERAPQTQSGFRMGVDLTSKYRLLSFKIVHFSVFCFSIPPFLTFLV